MFARDGNEGRDKVRRRSFYIRSYTHTHTHTRVYEVSKTRKKTVYIIYT